MTLHPDELGGAGANKRKPLQPAAIVMDGRVLDEGEELTAEEELVYHLTSAQQHAQTGLNLLYDPKRDVKRSIWYKMTLGRAQSILMSLLVRELRS